MSETKSSVTSRASLDRLYLEEDSPYALSGNTRELLEAGRALGIPPPQTQQYLRGEPSFTLHRPRRLRFPRSKTVVGPQLDSTWQADLVEMQNRKLIAANKRTCYLLTIIDVLSKYAWVVGLKSKRGTAVRDGFQHVLDGSPDRRPKRLQTDQGKEFYNKHMTRLLEDYDVRHYSTRGEPKAAVVERFNRTLKEMVYKYMTSRNSPKYLEALPDLVHRYNTRLHSSIKMAPADVTRENADVIWRCLYKPTPPLHPYKFERGDHVRTSKRLKRGAFGPQSYRGTFSRDVYVVVDRRRSMFDGVNYYTLQTWQGQAVPGRFYEPQLQKVQPFPNRWRLQQKLKYKGRGPRRQVLVNWQGLDPSYRTWIPVRDVKQYE